MVAIVLQVIISFSEMRRFLYFSHETLLSNACKICVTMDWMISNLAMALLCNFLFFIFIIIVVFVVTESLSLGKDSSFQLGSRTLCTL